MTTGTRWHAIRLIVAHSIIAGVQVIQNLQQKGMDRVPLRATAAWCSSPDQPSAERSRLDVNGVPEMRRNTADRTGGRVTELTPKFGTELIGNGIRWALARRQEARTDYEH